MVYGFAPTSAGPASTTSSGSWNGQNFNIALSGTGINPQFLISPTSLDFGPVHIGSTSSSQSVTVTNLGSSAVVMSGAGAGVGPPRPGVQGRQGEDLKPGGTFQTDDSFRARASGPASTNSIGDWNGQNFNIALSGNGRGAQFVITPTSLDFGPVQVGSSAPSQTVTVTNVGPSPVVMSGAGAGVGSPFS